MEDDKTNILKINKNKIGILRLTLDDQNNKNALSELMMGQMIEAIEEASRDNSIKIIVIAGTGNVFCSGHNLKEIKDAREDEDSGASYFLNLFNLCSSLMQLIVNCPKPVIAEVNGIATAAGCQLVASCDLAISSDLSKFATPGVNIGLFCSTPMVALTRAIGRKRAFEMLVTGRFIEAKEAKEIGLINKISEIDQLEKTTDELAMQITNKLGEAVKIGKEAFYKQAEMNLKDAYDYTGTVMAENMMLEQTKKGINFFLDKKTPEWDQ